MRSIEPGISRFRVWPFGPSRDDGASAHRQPHDLTVDTIETVIGTGLAGIALAGSGAHAGGPRAAGRPLDERLDTGRQGRPAAILAVMDHERARQRRRRA